MRKLIVLAVAATALALPATAAAANIVETAAGDPRFDTLVSLVGQAGLADELSGDAKLTVFAPTDAAFARVPEKTLDKLGRKPRLLKRVLLYHVAAADLKAADVAQRRRIRTLAKRKVRVRVRNENVFLNRRARVVQADVGADNGTIHVINRVLLPPAR
jgi:transforming growth factor-beta-induced protein